MKKRKLSGTAAPVSQRPAEESVIEVDEDLAAPDWEIALAEVAQRFPALDASAFPSPLPATVPVLMRHLLDPGPGQAWPGLGGDNELKATLAGGIAGGLRRLLSVEIEEVVGFLAVEVDTMLTVKERWGAVFERMIEPLVRQGTRWGDRPWPTRAKDQVALFAEYLSRDPEVVPALIAAVALGLRDPGKRERSHHRRIEQGERLLREYFARRGRHSYCDFVHATASACFSPSFRMVAPRLLEVAASALAAKETALRVCALELDALDREHRQALAGERVDIAALRRDREKAVAAAREEGMTKSADRVRFLEARVRELESQLDTVRRRASRERAYLARQLAAATSEIRAEPAPVAPLAQVPPAAARAEEQMAPATLPAIVTPADESQRRPLEGRRVFLYTNKERGGAREALFAELEALGASGPRVYETKGGSVPGPTAFPPRSVVIVDTTFMSHTASNVIRRRARTSPETLFLEDRFGVGGLAQRLPQRLARVSERQSREGI